MEKLRKGMLNISKSLIWLLFCITVVYLFLIGLFTTCIMAYTDEHIFYVKDFPNLLVLGLIVVIGIICFSIRKWEHIFKIMLDRKTLVIATVIWTIMISIWIAVTLMEPANDQSEVFLAAKDALSGNFEVWKKGEYMYLYPFQNGIVLFYMLFHYLFAQNAVISVEIFNLVCWYLTIVAMTKMTQWYYGENVAKMTYLVLLFFLPMWGYVTFVYGTIPGLCCSVWALYYEQRFERTEKYYYLMIIGLLLMLAVMWKNNYVIFMIAICIMLFLHAINERQWKALLGIVIVCSFFALQMYAIPELFHYLTGEDTKNGIPFIGWIVMGLQESVIAPGGFNGYQIKTFVKYDYDTEIFKQIAWEELRKQCCFFADNMDYTLRFFSRKIAAGWSLPTFESLTIINGKNYEASLTYAVKDMLYNGGIINTCLHLIMDIMQCIITFGLVVYAFLERKEFSIKKAGFLITFIGGFIFHLFWEIKSQYALPYFVVLIPYAIYGWYLLCGEIVTAWNQHRFKIWKNRRCSIVIITLILPIFLQIVPCQFLDSTLKLGVDTADYIWYCQNETQWKEEGFALERP